MSKNPKQNAKYAVIFPNQRSPEDDAGYATMAERMVELVSKQPGCLGFDSARDGQGFGITVSYWDSLDSIKAWKNNAEHQGAQNKGREVWYSHYDLFITRIEHAYFFKKPETSA